MTREKEHGARDFRRAGRNGDAWRAPLDLESPDGGLQTSRMVAGSERLDIGGGRFGSLGVVCRGGLLRCGERTARVRGSPRERVHVRLEMERNERLAGAARRLRPATKLAERTGEVASHQMKRRDGADHPVDRRQFGVHPGARCPQERVRLGQIGGEDGILRRLEQGGHETRLEAKRLLHRRSRFLEASSTPQEVAERVVSVRARGRQADRLSELALGGGQVAVLAHQQVPKLVVRLRVGRELRHPGSQERPPRDAGRRFCQPRGEPQREAIAGVRLRESDESPCRVVGVAAHEERFGRLEQLARLRMKLCSPRSERRERSTALCAGSQPVAVGEQREQQAGPCERGIERYRVADGMKRFRLMMPIESMQGSGEPRPCLRAHGGQRAHPARRRAIDPGPAADLLERAIDIAEQVSLRLDPDCEGPAGAGRSQRRRRSRGVQLHVDGHVAAQGRRREIVGLRGSDPEQFRDRRRGPRAVGAVRETNGELGDARRRPAVTASERDGHGRADERARDRRPAPQADPVQPAGECGAVAPSPLGNRIEAPAHRAIQLRRTPIVSAARRA